MARDRLPPHFKRIAVAVRVRPRAESLSRCISLVSQHAVTRTVSFRLGNPANLHGFVSLWPQFPPLQRGSRSLREATLKTRVPIVVCNRIFVTAWPFNAFSTSVRDTSLTLKFSQHSARGTSAPGRRIVTLRRLRQTIRPSLTCDPSTYSCSRNRCQSSCKGRVDCVLSRLFLSVPAFLEVNFPITHRL